jgi:hypothetical protein
MRIVADGRLNNISQGAAPQVVPGFVHYVISKATIVGIIHSVPTKSPKSGFNV